MIENKIDKIIISNFQQNNFSIKFKLNENNLLWDEFLKNQNYILDDYSNYVIDYRNLYLSGKSSQKLIDLSIVVLFEGKPIALWPLSLIKFRSLYKLSSQNLPILEPLAQDKISLSLKKKLIDSSLKTIDGLKNLLKIDSVLTNDKIINNKNISIWHEKNLMISKALYSDYLMYVDLTQDISKIKNKIRKSFKSLITLANKQYEFKVIRIISKNDFSEYIDFHKFISGKMTRKLNTWILQMQNINAQKAFIVEARKNDELLGYGLYRHTRDEGFYEVGVYNRDSVYNNLSHGINFAAIIELKNRGCKWYYIGDLNFNSKYSKPNQKEISISFFEKGFASHIYHYNTFLI